MRQMMRATIALLKHEPGEAVLLFNGELTVLQRIGGKLLLNERWEGWEVHAHLLSEVTLPHELCFVASLALDEFAPSLA